MWSGADNTYLAAITAAAREYSWHGTITDVDGTTYSFVAKDIVRGSGQISRTVSSSTALDIGTVYTAELTIRLYLTVNRYKLYNGTISLFCDVDVNGTNYPVPMGVFRISECMQELSCISITAYDDMTKFDEALVPTDQGQATAYGWISYLCTLAGVTLGSTSAEIDSMPNSDEALGFLECDAPLSSYTCREALAQICEAICANAFIGRDGRLYIKQYGMTAVDDIAANERFASSLSDYTTHYTAVSLGVSLTGNAEYYAIEQDDGLTYDLGVNPWLQFSMPGARNRVCMAIINSLSQVSYEPFAVSMPLRPELDPMDVLTFSGNQASGSDKGAITSIVYKLSGAMTVKCSGGNPRLASAKSKATRKLNAVATKVSESERSVYYFENIDEITVEDVELATVATIAVEAIKEVRVTIIYTVNFHATRKGRYYLYLYLDGEPFKTYHDVCSDGDNVVTVHATFNIEEARMAFINVYMRTEGYTTVTTDGTWDAVLENTWEEIGGVTWAEASAEGTYSDEAPLVTIAMNYSQLTVFGRGLLATDAWDGTLEFSERIYGMSVNVLGEVTDSAVLSALAPDDRVGLVETVDASEFTVIGEIEETFSLELNG